MGGARGLNFHVGFAGTQAVNGFGALELHRGLSSVLAALLQQVDSRVFAQVRHRETGKVLRVLPPAVCRGSCKASTQTVTKVRWVKYQPIGRVHPPAAVGTDRDSTDPLGVCSSGVRRSLKLSALMGFLLLAICAAVGGAPSLSLWKPCKLTERLSAEKPLCW